MSEMKEFKELTREERIDLLDALQEGELEWCSRTGDWRKAWVIDPSDVMRRRPKHLTKPSIDVSHVSAKCKWLARNNDGDAYLYRDKPNILGSINAWVNAYPIDAEVFASYDPGTCDWKDSLVDLDAIRRERCLL